MPDDVKDPPSKPAKVLNWRTVGMTAGVVAVVLALVLAYPLVRARANPSPLKEPGQ